MTGMPFKNSSLVLLLGVSAVGLAGCVTNPFQQRSNAAYEASIDKIDALAPKMRTAGGSAGISAPRIGTRLKWSCQGPYATDYDLTVMGIDKGLVRYSGNIVYAGSASAYPYESEKHWTLTGTGLWSSMAGGKRQWFDYEYFRGFDRLEPGSVFRGPVPGRAGISAWVSDFEITVGDRKRINHDVLGRITVVPITEKRKTFHKDYTATLVTLLEPKQGISVSWTFTDKNGKEECNLVRRDDKQGAAS